jgi:AcrB/AcrD/AcrF family
VALFGIALENGMVLVTSLNQLVRDGIPLPEASVRGACLRLRPVLMTALTTTLGLLPLLFAQGTGSEVQRPLATVVLGGLVTSTLLTLLVIPALYPWFAIIPAASVPPLEGRPEARRVSRRWAQTQARINELADKCTEGQLTPAEHEAYDTYISVIDFITVLQAKAHTVLEQRLANWWMTPYANSFAIGQGTGVSIAWCRKIGRVRKASRKCIVWGWGVGSVSTLVYQGRVLGPGHRICGVVAVGDRRSSRIVAKKSGWW